jgi:hypothetical protein
MSTNELKLESARQELRNLPAEWRNIYANYKSLVNIRDARVETLFLSEVLSRPGNPLNPAAGEFGGRVVAGVENAMLGRAAIPAVLVQIIEDLPQFKEATETVGAAVAKIRKAESTVAADHEAFAKAEAALAEAEAAFVAEAKAEFEKRKAETLATDPKFAALRSAAEAAAAKVGK